MKIAYTIAGRVTYIPLFDIVREHTYITRWDHDDLDEFIAAVTEYAVEWTGESNRRAAEITARKCARWTWENFTVRPEPETD